ncbi:GvpL/GvpF family gas vesicle protein [Halobacillus fulvus]|nr:GvpL/GvpF family gas vesicle protein [Halobacillus fulvus]
MMSDLLYLYGIIQSQPSDSELIADQKGIDERKNLKLIPFGSISAVVCPVDREEYGEEEVEEKLKQPEWVKEKAFHHHETLLSLSGRTTLIPMKFCTLFKDEQNLEELIGKKRSEWESLLNRLAGKEEWNLKIYSHTAKMREDVESWNETVRLKKREIEGMSKGKQYIYRKKLEKTIDDEILRHQNHFASTLHESLLPFAQDNADKKIWQKDVTGRNEEMCLNKAYLIDTNQVEDFLATVDRSQTEDGWTFEVTGPWPAYHFVDKAGVVR